MAVDQKDWIMCGKKNTTREKLLSFLFNYQ